MTKKEYCLTNEAIATHDYYRMQLHGIIGEYAYISRLYQPTVCGETKAMFHKVLVRYDAEGMPYINITERLYSGKKHIISLFLDSFFRVGMWNSGIITCDELKAIA